MSSILLAALLDAALAILVATTLVWILSVVKKDASIVDVFWGLGFVLTAWIYRLAGAEPTARQLLVLGLVTLWGARLALYIAWRNRGHGEDYRYRQMREKNGPGFAWKSLFIVFYLQGALVLLIGLPHLFLQAPAQSAAWRWSDALGIVFFAVGFFFEVVGDWQMARFKADPANRGQVLDRGLWRYTRHPNYFGDAMVWWGFYAFALAAPGGAWTLPCPILMTFFLLRVSGVALLEKTIVERRPQYREYIDKTPAFLPWFPRRG